MLALVVAIFLLLAVLPSALNLPQTNPSTTLEYAPVPPGRQHEHTAERQRVVAWPREHRDTRPRCRTGAEPRRRRQEPEREALCGISATADRRLMSPPYMRRVLRRNNGGSTYQGVAGDEIVVLIYGDKFLYSSRNDTTSVESSSGGYCDIDLPPNTGGKGCYIENGVTDHVSIRNVRRLSRYFNDRFQTYGRHVHFWTYLSHAESCNGCSVAERRAADAADNYKKLKPFAVVQGPIFNGFFLTYAEAMAKKKVLEFTGGGNTRAYYLRHAPQIWSFSPDIEHWANDYVLYVCRRVAPHRVTHAAGGVGLDGRPMNGRTRRYAFMWADTAEDPGLKHFVGDSHAHDYGGAACSRWPRSRSTSRAEAPWIHNKRSPRSRTSHTSSNPTSRRSFGSAGSKRLWARRPVRRSTTRRSSSRVTARSTVRRPTRSTRTPAGFGTHPGSRTS